MLSSAWKCSHHKYSMSHGKYCEWVNNFQWDLREYPVIKVQQNIPFSSVYILTTYIWNIKHGDHSEQVRQEGFLPKWFSPTPPHGHFIHWDKAKEVSRSGPIFKTQYSSVQLYWQNGFIFSQLHHRLSMYSFNNSELCSLDFLATQNDAFSCSRCCLTHKWQTWLNKHLK